MFEWNIEHSQIQNKKSTLQSLKSHKHPGRGGPYRKPQKSWEKKKTEPHKAISAPWEFASPSYVKTLWGYVAPDYGLPHISRHSDEKLS